MKDTKQLTTERGENYGPPINHFTCTQSMYKAWCENRNNYEKIPDKELAIRHGIYMICDKLARMAKNPYHRDNLDDIAGYARCIAMVLDEKTE